MSLPYKHIKWKIYKSLKAVFESQGVHWSVFFSGERVAENESQGVHWPFCFLQESESQQMNRKVFIGRCHEDMTADDLRNYFCKFGEVLDVFIPKPFRAFAFVTFSDPEVAQNLCGDDHIIAGTSVHISTAAPKNYDKERGKNGGSNQPGGGGGGGGGYGQNQGYGGWNQGNKGSGGGNMGGQNMGGGGGGNNGNMNNNPLGMGGLNLGGPFQLNPAMLAAAQAALTQGGWGLLGMANNQGGAGAGDGTNNPQANAATNQGFGNFSSPTAPAPQASNQTGFLGWGGAPQGDNKQQQQPQNVGWGQQQQPANNTTNWS